MTPRLYLDACMIIDLVEGRPEQQARLAVALKGRTVVSSELARLESRIGALRAGHAACGELWTNDERLAASAEGRIRILTWDDLGEQMKRDGPLLPPTDPPDGEATQ